MNYLDASDLLSWTSFLSFHNHCCKGRLKEVFGVWTPLLFCLAQFGVRDRIVVEKGITGLCMMPLWSKRETHTTESGRNKEALEVGARKSGPLREESASRR